MIWSECVVVVILRATPRKRCYYARRVYVVEYVLVLREAAWWDEKSVNTLFTQRYCRYNPKSGALTLLLIVPFDVVDAGSPRPIPAFLGCVRFLSAYLVVFSYRSPEK